MRNKVHLQQKSNLAICGCMSGEKHNNIAPTSRELRDVTCLSCRKIAKKLGKASGK